LLEQNQFEENKGVISSRKWEKDGHAIDFDEQTYNNVRQAYTET